MATNDTRPVNLDLFKFSFPITAIASILHRITAVIIWVGLGILLYALHTATGSEEGAECIRAFFSENFFGQFIVWGLLTALAYYCLATAKHIIQDFGFCEDLKGGQIISWTVIVIGVVFAIVAGVYVWA